MAIFSHIFYIFIVILHSYFITTISNSIVRLDTDNQVNKISAILSQDAFLPCETRRSIGIDAVTQQKTRPIIESIDHINLILWYRDNSSIPFYTIDSRSNFDDNYPHHHHHRIISSSSSIMGLAANAKHLTNDTRMEFDLRKLTPLLRIRNITEADEGLYQCRVEYASARTFINEMRLSVIGPPTSLQIFDSNGVPLEGVIGPFNEFDSISLICAAYGGKPKPRVIWLKRQGYYEEIVDDSYESSPLTRVTNGSTGLIAAVINELRLNRLDRKDYLARYTCRATSSIFHHQPLMRTITVDMNLHPVNVRIYTSQFHSSPQSAPLIAGRIAQFGCRTDGSKPAANIEWFLGHQRIVPANQDTFSHFYSTDTNYTVQASDPNKPHRDHTAHASLFAVGSMTNDWSFASSIAPASPSASPLSSPKEYPTIVVGHQSNSTLSAIRFTPSHADNGRILSCHAWNPFITNSKIVDKLVLDVHYGPQLTIDVGSKTRDILIPDYGSGGNISSNLSERPQNFSSSFSADGSSSSSSSSSSNSNSNSSKSKSTLLLIAEQALLLELNCHIKANPWIDQVIWYVNGQPIIASAASSTTTIVTSITSSIGSRFESSTSSPSSSSPSSLQFSSKSFPYFFSSSSSIASSSSSSSSSFSSSLPVSARLKTAHDDDGDKLPTSTTYPFPSAQSPNVYLTNRNQTLRIENVRRFHAARYQCSARNAIDVAQSEIVELNVAYKPSCLHNRTQFVDVTRNVPMKLACRVDANPNDRLTFRWTLGLPWRNKPTTKSSATTVNDHDERIISTSNIADYGDSRNISESKVDKTQTSMFELDDLKQSRSISAEDNDNGILDVDQAVQRYVDHLYSLNVSYSETEVWQQISRTPLLLQCDAQNVAGRQQEPCTFLLRIVDGPPQKPSRCTFTTVKFEDETKNRIGAHSHNGHYRSNESSSSSSSSSNSSTGTVLVRCLPGNDGGKVQTFHLIGLLVWSSNFSNVTSKPLTYVKNDDDALSHTEHKQQQKNQQQQQQQEGDDLMRDRESSIIELIQSIQASSSSSSSSSSSFTIIDAKLSNMTTSERRHKQPVRNGEDNNHTTVVIRWNLSANQVPHFELTNVSIGAQYDVIVFASNLIGRSEALFFRNRVLLPFEYHDNDQQQQADQNAYLRPNWVYLRFKGLAVVLILLLIMALIGVAIRSYLSTAGNSHYYYDRGTHASRSFYDDVETEAKSVTVFNREEDRAESQMKQNEQQPSQHQQQQESQRRQQSQLSIGSNSRAANLDDFELSFASFSSSTSSSSSSLSLPQVKIAGEASQNDQTMVKIQIEKSLESDANQCSQSENDFPQPNQLDLSDSPSESPQNIHDHHYLRLSASNSVQPPGSESIFIGRYIGALKRLLNRFALIDSHYRSYNLTTCESAIECPAEMTSSQKIRLSPVSSTLGTSSNQIDDFVSKPESATNQTTTQTSSMQQSQTQSAPLQQQSENLESPSILRKIFQKLSISTHLPIKSSVPSLSSSSSSSSSSAKVQADLPPLTTKGGEVGQVRLTDQAEQSADNDNSNENNKVQLLYIFSREMP